MATTLTPKELAKQLDTDPKRARKFLRSKDSGLAAEAPGKGGRWAIDARKVKGLKSKFVKWDAADRAAAEAARNARNAAVTTPDEPEAPETTED